MQYKPKNIAALHVALGGLPDAMHVEADRDVGVSAKTVGELRKVTAWPENLVIATPQERNAASGEPRHPPYAEALGPAPYTLL